MYKYRCNKCGAYLEPSEKCDCQEEEDKKRKYMEKLYSAKENGQFMFDLVREVVDS